MSNLLLYGINLGQDFLSNHVEFHGNGCRLQNASKSEDKLIWDYLDMTIFNHWLAKAAEEALS